MVEDGVKLQDAFDGIKSKDEDLEILTDDTVQPLLKEVEDELLKGTSEEEAVKHFLDEINRDPKKSDTQKTYNWYCPSRMEEKHAIPQVTVSQYASVSSTSSAYKSGITCRPIPVVSRL